MTEPLVSVKIITYNHAPFIAQAIEGGLQQKTNFPFELVIGEDCSTDGTREIVFEYQKKYPEIIRAITSEKNVGMIKNSDRTTKECRGKYLAFCEGDDYWHRPDKLQKQVEYLESHPDCGMVSADCDILYDESKYIKKSYNNTNGFKSIRSLNIEEILWGKLAIWTATVVVRRKLYENIIGNDAYLYKNVNLALGDLQVWAELAYMSRVMYLPETFATYRVLAESASRSADVKKSLRFQKSLSDIKLYLCDKYNLSTALRREEEITWCDRTLRLAFHEKNVAMAEQARKMKNNFTWLEWLRYYGTKNSFVHNSYRAVGSVFNLFRKRRIWP